MISQAFAQGASAFGGLESLSSFLPLVLIFVVFYFFLIRPQQKKAQQHRDMVAALRRGDRVVTNGGLIGTVVRLVDDREIELEIAQGVSVYTMRGMIADVMAKPQPLAKAGDATSKTVIAMPEAGGSATKEKALEKVAVSGKKPKAPAKAPVKKIPKKS